MAIRWNCLLMQGQSCSKLAKKRPLVGRISTHPSLVGSMLKINMRFALAHAHYIHGALERSILRSKESLMQFSLVSKCRCFHIRQHSTFVPNDMPICVGSKTNHLGTRDLLTPTGCYWGTILSALQWLVPPSLAKWRAYREPVGMYG